MDELLAGESVSDAGPAYPSAGPVFRSQLDYALNAARQGYYVFPCVADGKVPQVRRWESVATVDEEQIRRWWTRWPDANIGAAVGASGISVLDVDVRDGKRGTQSLDELEIKFGELPRTRV